MDIDDTNVEINADEAEMEVIENDGSDDSSSDAAEAAE